MKDAYINGKIIDGTKEMQVKEEYAILVGQGKIKDVVLQEEGTILCQVLLICMYT